MILAALLLLIAPADDPTRSGMVALDFRDRPIAEVVRAIGERSGNAVNLESAGAQDDPRRLTLEAPAPVPFWEAIDRLCASGELQHHLNDGAGGTQDRGTYLALYGPLQGAPTPGFDSGPFRFARLALHAGYERVYIPTMGVVSREASPPFRAEFSVLVEPRVIAIRTGPLEDLEALDDRGRSLLPADVNDLAMASEPPGGYNLIAFSPRLRVPMSRPRGEGGRLRILRGVMPVEVAIMPEEPSATIPLAGAAGKSVSAGDVRVTITEFGPGPGETLTLKLVAKIEGPRGETETTPGPIVFARSWALQKQIEIVDAKGKPLRASSGGSSAGEELRYDYLFAAPAGVDAPVPTHLRLYAPRWVPWRAPFEFKDLPLP